MNARTLRRSLLAVAVLTATAAGCGSDIPTPVAAAPEWAPASSWAPAPINVDGLAVLATAADGRFELHTADQDRDFIAGVNLGATTPGHSPGELSVDRPTYRRWLAQMGTMGIRVVRIYTIHPPAFYEEVVSYNLAHPTAPLYVVQGVYLPDESYTVTGNLYDPGPAALFVAELRDAVAAVHGDLLRAPAPGRSDGTWRADISPWMAGYLIGVEWDPPSTYRSDAINAAAPAYVGTYFSSAPDATPTERWLASMLDVTATTEAAYGTSVPLAFTNWPSTDPLDHPLEPLENEDLVNVDANRVVVSDAWPGGYFASYHAYPYYPDFQRYEYAHFMHNGRVDNFAGYLTDLRDHHLAAGIPTLITEFGVPAALGSAHEGPRGRDQGNHSEQEAMAVDAELFELIHDLGLGGATLFEWNDEWFKFTWNTVDQQLPADRRPMWHDPWTNEQHFGLLATEAGNAQAVTIDANLDEWLYTDARRVFQADTGTLRELSTYYDESYLYLGVRFDRAAPWDQEPVVFGFDTTDGRSAGLPGLPGVGAGADVAVALSEDGAKLVVRPAADPFTRLYGQKGKYFRVDPADLVDGADAWVPRRLITNRPLRDVVTGQTRAMETIDLSDMLSGTTDPADPAFDSRTLWATNGDVLEMRIPWAALGFSDPSSSQVLTFADDGAISGSRTSPGVGVTVAAGPQVVTHDLTIDPWQTTTWHERPKAGLDVVSDMLRDLADVPRR